MPERQEILDDEVAYNFEARIRDSIAYTRACHAKGTNPIACSHFRIPVTNDSRILTLVRDAETKGLATFIYGSPKVECYSIGISPQPRYLREPNHSWFVNSSRAEMRAGPIRTDADVKIAEREIGYQQERRNRSETVCNGKLRMERETIIVGLKRQILGLPMDGKINDKEVARAMEEHGEELKAIEGSNKSEDETFSEEEVSIPKRNAKRRRHGGDDADGDDENQPNKAAKKQRPIPRNQPRQSRIRNQFRPSSTQKQTKRKSQDFPEIQEESDDEWRPVGF